MPLPTQSCIRGPTPPPQPSLSPALAPEIPQARTTYRTLLPNTHPRPVDRVPPSSPIHAPPDSRPDRTRRKEVPPNEESTTNANANAQPTLPTRPPSRSPPTIRRLTSTRVCYPPTARTKAKKYRPPSIYLLVTIDVSAVVHGLPCPARATPLPPISFRDQPTCGPGLCFYLQRMLRNATAGQTAFWPTGCWALDVRQQREDGTDRTGRDEGEGEGK